MTRPALRALEQAYGRAVGALTMLDLLRGQALSEAVRPTASACIWRAAWWPTWCRRSTTRCWS
jgi:hypothetical protein